METKHVIEEYKVRANTILCTCAWFGNANHYQDHRRLEGLRAHTRGRKDMESTSPSLQRTILRLVQTHGTIERGTLGLQSRSHDPENWEAVLDDLVDRGLITEGSTIRVGKKSYRQQKRAVITYALANPGLGDFSHPKFSDMTPEDVQKFVSGFPRRTTIAS